MVWTIFMGGRILVRSNSSVRKPALAHSDIGNKASSARGIGEVMKKAQRELFFKRITYAILAVLLLTFIVYAVVGGYAEVLIDRFFSLMG